MNVSIELDERLVCDLELLLNGGFYPLTGFMTEKEYNSVVKNMKLPSSDIWPMPIVLPIKEEMANRLKHETTITLIDNCNLPLAKLTIEDIYKPNLKEECKHVFGTTDKRHPYVKVMKKWGNIYYVGGKVEQINKIPHYDFDDLRLTPQDTKAFIKDNGWTTVVGFQTRNPMHKSHFELTQYALRQTGVDDAKLLLQPTVGVTQDEDIDYHTRVKCYKLLVKHYPPGLVKLCLLPLSMRMGGPREALWHALIRKNFGCTHFVVGRDHSGPSVKNKKGEFFYGPYEAHELVTKYADQIGIKVIMSQMIVYVKEIENYLPMDKITDGMTVMNISGTEQRRLLRNGDQIPEWFTFPEIFEELKKTVRHDNEKGFCIYIVGLSGSGKTTIANHLQTKLKEYVSRPITVLDGDVVRKNLSYGLGFNKEDRSTNVRRIGYVASEIVKHNGIVICANIAPYNNDRLENRKLISQYGEYIEVYVNTPIETCEERDVKGLYKMARKGILKMFTGVDDPFEEPVSPEIVLNDQSDIGKSIGKIIKKLEELKLIKVN